MLKPGEKGLALVDGLHGRQLWDLGKGQPVPVACCRPAYTQSTAGPREDTNAPSQITCHLANYTHRHLSDYEIKSSGGRGGKVKVITGLLFTRWLST